MAKVEKKVLKVSSKKEQKSVKSILITQPKPDSIKSPYYDLAERLGIELDFHPFISVEGVSGKDFRKQKINISEYTAIIFTSRSSVDHFFRIVEELKIKVSSEMKYFCIAEAVALYLQKFILYRKRKVFFSADASPAGLKEIINKHKENERFIFPISDNGKGEVREFLDKNKVAYTDATLYRMVSNEISDVMKKKYDLIVFFSPYSVQTLLERLPKFKQNGTLIGAFGPTTSKAVIDAGFTLEVKAPMPNAPSMVAALEQFISKEI